MDQFKDAQAQIDEMFEQGGGPVKRPATERILAFAQRGVEAPESLSYKEVQQVCYALAVHYSQMGIDE